MDSDLTRTPQPGTEGEERTVAAVLARFGRARRVTSPFALAAAALLLVGVGLGLGLAIGRGGTSTPSRDASRDAPTPARDVPAAWAAHERNVFAEARASLGQDLAWLASEGATVTLGLSAAASTAESRVVFLELVDATGTVVRRSRLVIPDGREVEVRLAGLSRFSVRAERGGEGRLQVAVSAAFPDGAALSATTPGVAAGESVLLGQVLTDDAALSLFVAAF